MSPRKVIKLDSVRTKKELHEQFLRKHTTYYTLDAQHKIIPTRDIMVWGRFFETTAGRIVAQDTIGKIKISTVFLGIDHGWDDEGPPVLFETMIFGGEHDQEQWRYCTWEEAEAGHRKALRMVRRSVSK